MKRFIALMLVLLMLLPCVAACKKDEVPEETTKPVVPITVASGEKSDYVIVYSASEENNMAGKYEKYADLLQSFINITTKAKLEVVSEDKPSVAKEIVIGPLVRAENYISPVDALIYQKGYSLFIADEKIVLEAGSEIGLKLGVHALLKALIGVDLLTDPKAKPEESKTEFSLMSDFTASETFVSETMPYMSHDLSEYAVCYDNLQYNQKRGAVILQQEIKSVDKVVMERVEQRWSEEGKPYFWFETDNTLASGSFRIRTAGTRITISAKDYYGFISAARAVVELRKDLGFYPFREGSSNEGVHLDYLKAHEASSKYAYNNSSEYRVMFYNVYWGGTEVERGILQSELVLEYRPDVVGFQEFKENRRSGIVTPLKAAGYEEAMDYKKGNFVSGNSGETKNSLYNYVPIFYNTATTKCVDSGYYRYARQFSVDESASKSLSWGVFESKATGERYLVVNTHMCTQDDLIKGVQAKEAVALINELLTRYDVPVFLGGDYNGTYGSANYTYFASEAGGLTDIEKNNLATIYTSKLRSYHRPYPDNNVAMGLMWPAEKDDTGVDPSGSVDHIMIKNASAVKISVYGVIADNYAMCGGDHYPIFADFSIN